MKRKSFGEYLPLIGKIAVRFLITLLVTLLIFVMGLLGAMSVLVNGPSPSLGNLFILSLKETSAAGFLADWFMSESEINALLAQRAEDAESNVDASLIKLPEITADPEGPGEFTEQGGGAEDGALAGIEVHDVRGGTYNGKMIVVKDPRRVFVGVPDEYGEDKKGLSLSAMIEKYGAIGGTNAGGFIDPSGSGTGGLPEGIVIYEGELRWGEMDSSYSIAGIDGDGLLHVGKMTGQRAMELGIKYAVSYGPALIINGEPCNAKRSLGGGINPRTAIGQRADGAMLLLVVNGRQIDSLGATLDDLVEVMLKFGALIASNLGGGSSSLMKLDGEFLNTSSYILGGERVLASAILIK